MDTKHVLGIIGIAGIVVVIAAAAGYMLTQDGGQDDGGDSSDDGRTVLEYTLNVRDAGGGGEYYFDVHFKADVPGSFTVYLGNSPIILPYGNTMTERWHSSVNFDRDYSGFYEAGQDIEYVQANLHLVFSSNIDAIRV